MKITNKFKFILKNKRTVFSFSFLFFLISFSFLAKSLPKLNLIYDMEHKFEPFLQPNIKNWGGTDAFGIDVFSYVILGFWTSFSVAFVSTFISCLVGTILGIMAGYFRGFWNYLISILCDFIIIFPSIVVVIFLLRMFGNNIFNILIVLSIFFSISFTKAIKTQVLTICEKDFVKSAKSLGANNIRIIIKCFLPGIIPTLVLLSSNTIIAAMVTISSLSLMGLGFDYKEPELGSLLKQAKNYFFLDFQPHLLFFPLAVLFCVCLSFYCIGREVSKIFDPQKNI